MVTLLTSFSSFCSFYNLHLVNIFVNIVVSGVADIMGRKFGSVKIPYNQSKSWAGSISMFLFGFLVSVGCALELYYFQS